MPTHTALMACIAFTTITSLTAGTGVSARVAPVKETFVAGEPIDLLLTVDNETGERLRSDAGSPLFDQYPGDSGIRLTSRPEIKNKPWTVRVGNPWLEAPGDPVTSQ